MRKTSTILVLLLFLSTSTFFSTISAKASTTNIADNEFFAEFNPGGFDDGTALNMYDTANQSLLTSNYDAWSSEWNNSPPEGIYIGPAFEPYVIELPYNRLYENTWMELSWTMNFSKRDIMNGASSFWVRLPYIYDSDLYQMDDNVGTQYWTQSSNIRPYINDKLVRTPQTYVRDEHVYCLFHYIITPEVDYTFSVDIPFNSWGVSNIPVNGYYDIDLKPRLDITSETLNNNSINTVRFHNSGDTLDQQISLPEGVSFGTSYIFTNGLGLNGLFGRSYPVTEFNYSVDNATYPENNYTSPTTVFQFLFLVDHDNTNGSLSFKIPFVSIVPIYLVNATVRMTTVYATFNGSIESEYKARKYF